MFCQLKERREGKKLLEKGFLSDLPGLSAGDCAEWIPNSARNSCLHCERPFTLILRRHHCRMCGELVCGLCSPHRVRLAEEGRPESTTAGTAAAGEDGDGGDGVQGPSSRRRHHRRSRHARVGPDVHFSWQIVTVASSATLQQQTYGSGVENDDDVESLLRRMGDGGVGSVGSGGGGGGGGGGVVSARGLVRDNRRGDAGAVASGAGDGGGSVERVEEAACSMEGVPGDVVLEDVLEWGRIQRRASKSWEVVGACLLIVVEMHHKKLLQLPDTISGWNGEFVWRLLLCFCRRLTIPASHTTHLRSPPPPGGSSSLEGVERGPLFGGKAHGCRFGKHASSFVFYRRRLWYRRR
ncbi:zinc finger, FYVE domain containing 28 [Ectocarpus siliculosus]|uniref:Zinc finger, FYVE domain containing 28 n=1 Tax=Ectocarpus siliculosus TaxID=2880 RepID=D8LMR5_ECTSI|nr:zinc finger, FYVE domain containing 28 [Ectocarpus siliculosus]|eukprot:CBN74716.1 zinc finger, FYVE domain containing 28 [Ectocarpus siliculosus]